LTATPRDEINRDTYRIFDLEAGNPTFAYERQDAINDGYLVPPTGMNVPFKFLRRGVKYSELSPEEQQEYEEKFFDEETGEIPDEINSAALNRWLFNENTVDQALEILMEWGLKIDRGDRLGKTIIFARNHQHAEFIVERFDFNYRHHKGAFARVIDSHDRYAQTILDDFSDLDKEPTIAVSVDMLDTGVDVPEVLNLVFFKPVYSEVKFNQMVGRGTRLCPNLFGVGRDKTEFLIFDLCDNFAYFEQEVKEKESKPAETLTSRLLKAKLELQEYLSHGNQTRTNQSSSPYQSQNSKYALKEPQNNAYAVNKEDSLSKQLLDELHQHVASMEENNFLVRKHLQQVETFSNREKWNNLTSQDKETIINSLIPLPNSLPPENPRIKNFDLLCLKVQLAVLKNTDDFEKLRDQIRDLLARLEAKKTIPAVKEKLNLIEEVQQESWWQDVTPHLIEQVRKNLRELMVFLEKQDETIIYTDFQDELGDIDVVNVPTPQTGFSPYQYRKKVEAYIRANQDHVAIAKLRRNLPLTESDLTQLEKMLFSSPEIENREKFEEVFGQNISLKTLIRQLVGLDRNSAKEAFTVYLENHNLTANQIRFIEQIIDWLTQHGVMNPYLLYEAPFTDIHTEGLDGVFNDDDADNIIAIVRSFNDSVEIDFESA
jgi:type I restriction enzyme R subunit